MAKIYHISSSCAATLVCSNNNLFNIQLTGLSKTCSPSSIACDNNENQVNKPRRRKSTRKEKCCLLGRKMAKIGDSCTYASSLTSIKPDFRHFHKMKTKLWINSERPVVKVKLLRKCKRFKAFYEKCCSYESEMIEMDIKRMIKRLKNFLKKRRMGKKKRTKMTKGKASDFP